MFFSPSTVQTSELSSSSSSCRTRSSLKSNARGVGAIFRSRPRARPETCGAYPGNETRSNRSCRCTSYVVTCAIKIGG